MLHYAAFHLGLHCLPKYPYWGFSETFPLSISNICFDRKYRNNHFLDYILCNDLLPLGEVKTMIQRTLIIEISLYLKENLTLILPTFFLFRKCLLITSATNIQIYSRIILSCQQMLTI